MDSPKMGPNSPFENFFEILKLLNKRKNCSKLKKIKLMVSEDFKEEADSAPSTIRAR